MTTCADCGTTIYRGAMQYTMAEVASRPGASRHRFVAPYRQEWRHALTWDEVAKASTAAGVAPTHGARP